MLHLDMVLLLRWGHAFQGFLGNLHSFSMADLQERCDCVLVVVFSPQHSLRAFRRKWLRELVTVVLCSEFQGLMMDLVLSLGQTVIGADL